MKRPSFEELQAISIALITILNHPERSRHKDAQWLYKAAWNALARIGEETQKELAKRAHWKNQ